MATRTDPRGVRDFIYAVLDRPVMYRLPAQFDGRRHRSEDVESDDQGPFLWVSAVTLRSYGSRENPYPGMRDFAVDLAYVIDPTLEYDEHLELRKVAPVAVVEIDDAGDARPPVISAPSGGSASTTHLLTAEPFRQELEVVAVALAAIAGEPVDDVVTPSRLESPDDPAAGRAAYLFGGELLRYHGWDPIEGWVWRETDDPGELLYWIVNDIAGTLAWQWAQLQPEFAVLDGEAALGQLWLPRWQFLVNSLRTDWGRRTATAIDALWHGDREWDDIFADSPVDPSVAGATPLRDRAPAPTERTPTEDEDGHRTVAAAASPDPAPERHRTFAADTVRVDPRPWRRNMSFQVVLGITAGAAVLLTIALLLFRGFSQAPANYHVPTVATTPSSNQQAATVSEA
ncbi:MAG: hypothetical protein ACSLE6_15650, partial [Mycobacterium sp.]